MGVVSAIRLLPHTQGFAAKSGIISIKCSLCSRKTAQTDTPPTLANHTGEPGEGRALLKAVYNADNTYQPGEILHPAVTQMNLAVHVGQQGTDRAAIERGHFTQDFPIDLL